jgi:hypothetical protein
MAESRWRFRLEAGATAQVSPVGPDWRTGLGVELRLAVTKPTWGWILSTQLNTVDDLQLRTSRIEERKIPVDFGLRWSQIHPWGTTFVDTAAVVALMRLRQINVSNGSPAGAVLDLGGKTAIGVHFGHSTFAPLLRLAAEIYPAPRAISVDPSGRIGTTAWLWISAAIGVAGYFY